MQLVPTLSQKVIVQQSASRMHALVADVETYPCFLPWCQASHLSRESETALLGTVHFSLAGIQKSFTTRNTSVPGKSIQMDLVDGPFETLHGLWTFTPLSETSSEISLSLTYAFRSKLLKLMLGPVFYGVAHRLVDAFCKEAGRRYE